MQRMVTTLVFAFLAGLGGWLGYSLIRSDIEASVYRERLRAVSEQHERLIEQYNAAVRRTAVTELVVEDGALSVRIRDAAGVEREIPTPFDPAREVYVDYVVLDSRLWIRRMFDARTPPEQGLLIDPALAGLDWSTEGLEVGKAVYRALGEGRWVVSVTGDGSLGLRPAKPLEELDLQRNPEVRDFPPIEGEMSRRLDDVSVGDVLRRFVSGPGASGGD